MIPSTENLALFIIAGLTLNITPGPDMLFIIGQSLRQGRWAGIMASLGICSGCLVHTAAATCGISSLFLLVPAAYDIIRFAGAAYLIYLGIKVLMSPATLTTNLKATPLSHKSTFYQGAITNILNPKVSLFFLAFLPQFVDRDAASVPMQMLFLGLVFIFNGMLVCIAVALLASSVRHLLGQSKKAHEVMKWLSGLVFLGLGLRLAFLSRD